MQFITRLVLLDNLRLLLLESIREALDVLLEIALVTEELYIAPVNLDPTLFALRNVLVTTEASEAPVLANDDLLATGELDSSARYSYSEHFHICTYLILGSPQGLESGCAIGIPRTDRQNDLANVDTRNGTVRLSKGTTHTSLQSIGTSA
jgi:hypothetical protein